MHGQEGEDGGLAMDQYEITQTGPHQNHTFAAAMRCLVQPRDYGFAAVAAQEAATRGVVTVTNMALRNTRARVNRHGNKSEQTKSKKVN